MTANDKIIKLFVLKEGKRGNQQDKDILDDFAIDLDNNNIDVSTDENPEKELSAV